MVTTTTPRGLIFDIQSFSTNDGPGIRTLVFFKGCPLSCLWCANPEGMSAEQEIRHLNIKCKGCGRCASFCPKKAISKGEYEGRPVAVFDRKLCRTCQDRKCLAACPERAIEVSGKYMTVDEVMTAILRDRPVFKTEGGVTLSGGEPLYQPEFTLALLRACQKEMVNTAMESTLITTDAILDELISLTDYFLVDLKVMDLEKHKRLTGVSNELILRNIRKVCQFRPVLVRIPLIPGYNDDDANILSTARFCLENDLSVINFLPYHKLGMGKFSQIGREYSLKEVQSPSEKSLQHICQLVESEGVTCVVS